MLDVLAAIHASKGDAPQPRPATDKSVRAVAILIDGPDPDTYLCTISVHNSEPIHGVPATSMDYTGITAVHVLLEPHTGRPVHVLGPAGDLPLGNIPTDSAGDLLTVTDRLIVPTSTGTYREDEAAWDRYSTVTFGGVIDMWQQAAPVATNLIPDPNPTTATTWSVDPQDGTNYVYEGFGPLDYDPLVCLLFYVDDSHTCKLWPVAAGASAIAVTVGTSYAVSVMVSAQYSGISHPDPTIMAVGVDWYDASGTLLSSSMADTINSTYEASDGDVWGSEGWIGTPTGTLTAPASAAYGRPFLYLEEGTEGYVLGFANAAQFSMAVA